MCRDQGGTPTHAARARPLTPALSPRRGEGGAPIGTTEDCSEVRPTRSHCHDGTPPRAARRGRPPRPAQRRPPPLSPRCPRCTTTSGEDAAFVHPPIDRHLVRRMLGLLRPYRRQYALGAGLGLVHIVLEMLSPRFTQEIIDHSGAWQRLSAGGVAARGRASSPAPRPGWSPTSVTASRSAANTRGAVATVIVIVALWALVIAASRRPPAVHDHGHDRGGGAGAVLPPAALRAPLQRLSMSYYDKTKLGRIISRCTSDIAACAR